MEEKDLTSIFKRVNQELRSHQIELMKMQNEELQLVQVVLVASRARHFDLFDLSPGGLCYSIEVLHEAPGRSVAAATAVRQGFHGAHQPDDYDCE